MAHDRHARSASARLREGAHDPILRPGDTCWQLATAERSAILCDNEAYFAAAAEAIAAAKHSVLLLAWCFDPRTALLPGSGGETRLGPVLEAAARDNPDLYVHVLCWDMSLVMSAARALFPQRAKLWFHNTRCRFTLQKAPSGTCHHQKLLTVDDTVAFCSGGDFLPNRWDSPEHLDRDERRRQPMGGQSPPRHDVTMLVDGPAAVQLARLARERIEDATGEQVPPSGGAASHRPAWPLPGSSGPGRNWPDKATVGIVRAGPTLPGRPAIRETLRLWLASIAAAERTIYIENQYFASPVVTSALAERLAEADGPEVIILCPRRAPSWFDDFFMGSARDFQVSWLQARDPHDRLRVYTPRARRGSEVLVHSKVAIVDDALFRVGSANISNRSFGVDTECDLAIDAAAQTSPATMRRTIRRTLHRSLSHFLGCTDEQFARAHESKERLVAAIEALDPSGERLQPLTPQPPRRLRRLVARYEIGNPYGLEDAWKAWARPRVREEALRKWLPLASVRPETGSE